MNTLQQAVCLSYIDPMLAQHRRWWTNIGSTLGQRVVLLGGMWLRDVQASLPRIFLRWRAILCYKAKMFVSNYVSPLYTEMETCCFTYDHSVLSVSLCLWVSHSFRSSAFYTRLLSVRRSNTKRWPNAGLMLALRLRRWPSISPLLSYRVVFGGTLANIKSALV